MSPRPPRAAEFGLGLMAAMAVTAALAPLLTTGDPAHQNLLNALAGPSATHPLGTDHLGRDLFARLVHGAADTLGIAAICVALAWAIGVFLGLVAAWRGGMTDTLIMRTADLTLAFPGMLLALLLAGLFGGGVAPMLIGIKLSLWPQFARMARAVGAGVMVEPHVEAAVLAGFRPAHILWRHVLPPALGQTVTLATLGIGSAVMSVSALGFLGLGLQPPKPEWGAMINELLPHASEAPLQIAAPCLMIFATVLGCTLTGEAMAARATRRTQPS